MEARAQLETGTSLPLLAPPHHKPPYSEKARAVELIWPVICFVVLRSTMVHGLSVEVISTGGHYSRKDDERAPLIGVETEALHGMDYGSDEGDSKPSISGDESP
jgi:sodium/hydrogen antiporter